MANLQLLLALAALSAFSSVALAGPKYVIEGRVYCDTCRAGFETSSSQYVEGAKVKLECRQYATDAIENTVEGVTDSTGTYHIETENNHDEEICEVVLVNSPVAGCTEIPDGRDRARVLVSGKSGLASNVRHANSLGFLKESPLPQCGLLLQQYALGVDG